MLECFYPDEIAKSTYDVDFQAIYDKGFRGIIFDIDNTLVAHGAPADDRAVRLFEKLKKIGFTCCLLSNNDKERVELFNSRVHVLTIEKAHKPSQKAYHRALALMKTRPEQTISIGDQIFTDIWGARRFGIYAVLVGQLDKKEEIQIVLKRYLEKIILHFYNRKQRKGRQK